MWLLAVLSESTAADAAADQRLVARMAAGDHHALGELYDRHARLLYSLALRIVRERADAEDVLQDAFAQAWRQASRFESGRGTVVGWLVTVTRSRALDRLRQRRARPAGADAELAGRDLPDPGVGIDVQLVTAEEADRVRRALEALSPEQRLPIELAYYEGLSQSEIAERLGVPLGTIKTRMRQTLRRLRDALAGEIS